MAIDPQTLHGLPPAEFVALVKRTSDQEITLFDSTGIALQESATIPLEYERALAAGVGIEKKMIST